MAAFPTLALEVFTDAGIGRMVVGARLAPGSRAGRS